MQVNGNMLSQDVRNLSSWLHETSTNLDDISPQDNDRSITKLLQGGYPYLHKLHAFKHIEQQLEKHLGKRISKFAEDACAIGPDHIQDYVREVTQQLLQSDELQLVQHGVKQDLQDLVQQLPLVQEDDTANEFLQHFNVERVGEEDSEVEILKLDSDDDDGSCAARSWGGCSFGEQQAEECIAKLGCVDLQPAALLELKAVAVDDLCNLSCWDRLCQALRLCLQTAQEAQVKQDAAQLVVSLLRTTRVDSPVQAAQLLHIVLADVLPTLTLEVDTSGTSATSFAELKQQVQEHALFPIVDVSLSALQDLPNCWHFLSEPVQEELSKSLCTLLHHSIAEPQNAASCVTHNVIRVNAMAAWLILDPSAAGWQQLWATAAASVSLSKHFKGADVIDIIQHDDRSKHLGPPHQPFRYGKGIGSRPQSGTRPHSGYRSHHAQTSIPGQQYQQNSLPYSRPQSGKQPQSGCRPHHTQPSIMNEQQYQQSSIPYSRPQSAARPRSGFRSHHNAQGAHPDSRHHHQQYQSNLGNQPGAAQGHPHGSFQGYQQIIQRLPSVNRHQGGRPVSGLQQRSPASLDNVRARQHSGGAGYMACMEIYRGVLALAVMPLITSAAARRCCIQGGGDARSGEHRPDNAVGLELVLCWCINDALLDTTCWWARHISQKALMEAAEQELEVLTPMGVLQLLQPLQAAAARKASSDEFLNLIGRSQTAAVVLQGVICTTHGKNLLVEGTTGLTHAETPLTVLVAALHRLISNQQGGWKNADGTRAVHKLIAVYVDIIAAVQPSVHPAHTAIIIKLAELLAKTARQSGHGQEQQDDQLLAGLVRLCSCPVAVHVAFPVPDVGRLCCTHLVKMYATGTLEKKEQAIVMAGHFALTTAGCTALLKAGFIQTVFACLEELFLDQAAGIHLMQCAPCSHPHTKLLQHVQQVFGWNHLLKCLKQEPASDKATVRQWLWRWLSSKPAGNGGPCPSPEALHLCLTALQPLLRIPTGLQQLDRMLDLGKLLQAWLQPVEGGAVGRSSLVCFSSMEAEHFVMDMNTAAILEVLQALVPRYPDAVLQRDMEDQEQEPAVNEALGSLQHLASGIKDDLNLSGAPAPRSPLEAAVCSAPGMRDGGLWLEDLGHALSCELAAGTELQYNMLAIMLQRTAMVALRGSHHSSAASSHWDHSHSPHWQPLKLGTTAAGPLGSGALPEGDVVLAAELWCWLQRGESSAQEHVTEHVGLSGAATTDSWVSTSSATRKAIRSLSWLMNACWSSKGGTLEHHPDFFLALISEIMGTQTTCEFLSHLTRSRAAQYWWPQWGGAVAGGAPMLRCCACVEFVLQQEEPMAPSLLKQAGVCLAQVVSNWLQHSFAHLLTCEEAVRVLCASLVLGPDYLIFTAVAVVQHLRPQWAAWHVSRELASQIWMQDAGDFSLCHWFHYMQELQNKYRHLVLDMMDM